MKRLRRRQLARKYEAVETGLVDDGLVWVPFNTVANRDGIQYPSLLLYGNSVDTYIIIVS